MTSNKYVRKYTTALSEMSLFHIIRYFEMPQPLGTLTPLLLLLLVCGGGQAAVSPPRWADPARNPCAAQPGGWQLLQWPGDGRCYRIFTVGPPGPCPHTQELAPDARTGAATCRCPPGRALFRSDDSNPAVAHGRCFTLFKRGPCPEHYYFAPLTGGENEERRLGACAPLRKCEVEGEVFWPATHRCYPALTRGPCPPGELLVPGRDATARQASLRRRLHDQENDTDPSGQISDGSRSRKDGSGKEAYDTDDEDGLPRCTCSSEGMLSSHYWAAASDDNGGTGACYEHFTRGPCLENGHLFLPGGVCGCSDVLPHFHNATGRCYQIGTVGPCPAGHRFVAAPGEARARCRCKSGHVPWRGDSRSNDNGDSGDSGRADDGACYRLYTRGPCPEGQFLLDMATCATLCQRGRLYFPQRNICYRVGLRGPCPRGQIVLFEDSLRPSVDGISYRGMCGCPAGVRDCGADYRDAAFATTFCDAKVGMVRWNGTCQALYSQGPCGENQWLVPEREGRLLWGESGWRRKQTSARCDCRTGFKAVKTDGILQCQPPAVSLAKFLNQKYHWNRSGGSGEWW